jgi:hypothetical protein
VLTAVTTDFEELHSVGAGDLLLSVNGVSTQLLSSSELERMLCVRLESFEVVASVRQLSKEQLSLNRHGFYAKGTYYCLINSVCFLSSVFVGYMGRHAILIAVTIEFSELHMVSVRDLLLSVNGVSTTLLSVEEIETVLCSDLESFEVVRKAAFDATKANNDRETVRATRRAAYQTIAQSWDYDHPCAFCGYVYLKSDTLRTQCCLNGRALDPSLFPTLFPLPPLLNHLARNRINHMSSNSTYYNNMLALGAVSVFVIVCSICI